jgi:alkaline phosphatase D
MRVDRRAALRLLAYGAASPAAIPLIASPSEPSTPFRHGVASGDPTQERLIIWTRVTPANAARRTLVRWAVAGDPEFRDIVGQGRVDTGPERDFTVKVDVGGLQPGRRYFYRFQTGGELSMTGQARTLPDGPTPDVVLVALCCAHYQCGTFNVYDAVARLPRVDAVIELGDYIYEDAEDGSAWAKRQGDALGRYMVPAHELLTLDDYRARHALYKTDPDLQAAHACAAWICQWDDHESANDCWKDGAEKHDPRTEGPWALRKAAALKAYYEWMPIREPAPGKPMEAAYRTFRFGDLASLMMMETRLIARAHQLYYERDLTFHPGPDGRPEPDLKSFMARLDDPGRQMLGAPQEAWLEGQLETSVAAAEPWQLLGSGTVMGRITAPDVEGKLGPDLSALVLDVIPAEQRDRARRLANLFAYGVPYDLDDWDGYPAARERLYGLCRKAGSAPIVLSGDSHGFWANELSDMARQPVGVEFGATSVTSPGICDVLPLLPVDRFIQEANNDVRFCDNGAKGFVRLTLTHGEALGELMAVSNIRAKPYDLRVLKSYRVKPGAPKLIEA